MTNVYAAAAAVLAAAAAVVSGAGIPAAVLLAVASAAAMTDARENRIPNVLAATAALSSAAIWVAAAAPSAALALAALAATGMYLLWSVGALGGGDVKYLPALVLAAATLGDPVTTVLRVLVFGGILLGIASAWPRTSDMREGPLAVGGPLALALTVSF